MKISMNHSNGHEWEPAKKTIGSVSCYVLSNKNPLGHKDTIDGSNERGNEERFEIYCPDVRSVLNGLQFGLSIRMTGVGDNGKKQLNLFIAKHILFDGVSIDKVVP